MVSKKFAQKDLLFAEINRSTSEIMLEKVVPMFYENGENVDSITIGIYIVNDSVFRERLKNSYLWM